MPCLVVSASRMSPTMMKSGSERDVQGPVPGDIDLAILWLAALRDIEVGHDLDARHERIAVGRRQIQVVLELAVLTEADLGLHPAGVALDVNIGSALRMSLD